MRFLVAPPGALEDVAGVERAFKVAGVRAIHVYREPGHVFGELLRASDRAGAVLATGATRAEAARSGSGVGRPHRAPHRPGRGGGVTP